MLTDSEIDAAEQAQLATNPLSLARVTRPGANLAARATIPTRRFVWSHLHERVHWVWAIIFAIAAVYTLWMIAQQFIGTWMLTWPLFAYLAASLLLLYYMLRGLGERLPIIGRSWAEVSPKGVRCRLFYGRRPLATFRSFRVPGLYWPARARIAWDDIARVALYQTYNRIEGRGYTWYWVKLWRRDATAYVLLITQNQPDAAALISLLTENAHLRRWATLDERGAHLADPALNPPNRDTLALWQADRRRIALPGYPTQINGDLWLRPDAPRFDTSGWLTRRTLLKAATLIILITVLINYELILSYILWTPPAPAQDSHTWTGPAADAGHTSAVTQTLIPPLHEVWSAKVDNTPSYYYRPNSASASIGGGKLFVISGGTAVAHNPHSGQVIANYILPDYANCGKLFNTASPDGHYLYYLAYPSDALSYDCYTKSNLDLTAYDTTNYTQLWHHTISSDSQFVLAANGLLIAVGTDRTILAFHADSGEIAWESAVFTSTATTTLAVGGDTVYVLGRNDLGGNDLPATSLIALDLDTGKTRWQRDTTSVDVAADTTLIADDNHAYLHQTYGIMVYDHASGEAQQVNSAYLLSYSSDMALQQGRIYISSNSGYGYNNDDAKVLTNSGSNLVPFINSPYTLSKLTAGRDLLFSFTAESISIVPFARSYHLLLFDRQTGRQVWRSPGYDSSDSNIYLGEGMLFFIANGQLHALTGAR